MKYPLALLCIAVLIAACTPAPQSDEPTIMTTFFPIQEIVKNVAGDTAAVETFVPPGVEPHAYEATPKDFIALNKADAFVTIGVEFAEFEEELVKSVDAKQTVISAGSGIALLDVTSEEAEEEHDEHGHNGKDPHIWLSPKNMVQMTRTIEAGLSQANPELAALYKANADAYVQKLQALDTQFSTELQNCKTDIVLVNHQAFAYLANDYGFKQIGIAGLEPESEPTPGQIKAIVDAAKENNIKYVLYESLVDPNVAKAIAAETGAQTLKLDPVEGAENPTDTYISVMEQNLQTLKTALECQ